MIWFWFNMPLAAAFFAAWVAVPMWLVFNHQGPAAPVTVQVPAVDRPGEPAGYQAAAAGQHAKDLARV